MFARMYNRGAGLRRCSLCGPGLGQTMIEAEYVGGPPRGLGQTPISPVYVGGPPRGLGMIPVAARFSYRELRAVLQRRAHAARTATVAGWSRAEANLVEAVEAGDSLYRGGYSAAVGTRAEWDAFLDTLGNAAWTLTSQRRARAAGTGGESVMVWEEEAPPITIRIPREPTPTPTPTGKPGVAPTRPAPGAPTRPPVAQAGIGAEFRQIMSSPWALAGALGVGAVVLVYLATKEK